VSTPPIIFLHIFKCGGTSIIDRMRAAVGANALFHVRGREDVVAELSRPTSALRTARVIAGHIPLRVIEEHFPDSPVFTVLRDPIDRMISQYLHFRREGTRQSETSAGMPKGDYNIPENQIFRQRFCAENSFADFVRSDDRRLLPLTQNHMVRRLAGLRGREVLIDDPELLEKAVSTLRHFAFALTTDQIDDRFLPRFAKTYQAQFGASIAKPALKLPKRKKNVAPDRGAAPVEIDPATIQHLIDQNRLDLALYASLRWFART